MTPVEVKIMLQKGTHVRGYGPCNLSPSIRTHAAAASRTMIADLLYYDVVLRLWPLKQIREIRTFKVDARQNIRKPIREADRQAA
jgi:hypothetical protein